MLPNLKTDLWKKKFGNKHDAPAESRGNGQQYPQAQSKGQNHIPFAFGSLVLTSAIFDETRGKRLRGGLRSFNAHADQETFDLIGLGQCTSIRKSYNG